MAKAGRPPGITPEITRELTEAIKTGAYIETAIVAAGVAKSTFYDWLRHAEKDRQEGKRKSVYIEFAKDIRKALATAELDLIKKVQLSGMHWQRYAWMLERRFRDRWALQKGDTGGGQKAA
jgi:molybdenum cofactor biosynthesis enzyme